VRGSVVGPGAVIGERASVTGGSIVGASVKVDADTVLVGARFPAGTATPQD
jgi:UDP-3-O-[3-hydroxymyristoyl] glucosamine N-acyltransferase